MKTRIKGMYFRVAISLGMLVTGICATGAVQAEAFLCNATQASSEQLPVLAQNCPIGKGIWGKVPAMQPKDVFWIQCGIMAQPLALDKAKILYRQITTDVWMKPEKKEFRCLIGPYQAYADASKDLLKVKRLTDYRQAFIRIVTEAEQTTSKAPVASVAPKPKSGHVITQPEQHTPQTSSEAGKILHSDDGNIEVRRQAQIGGRTYAIPYLVDNEHQFYMENNQAWNRLDYQSAQIVCKDIHMRLATKEEFATLLKSGQMEKGEWPLHLPYWGQREQGFFSDGRVVAVKSASLLNILCIK